MRESPGGARFAPLISTHVLGAMTAPSPSAFATSDICGPRGAAVIVKLRDLNCRSLPGIHALRKKPEPVSLVWPAAAPGDMNDGYQPSICVPSVPSAQG